MLDLTATDSSLKGGRGGFAMAHKATACLSTGVHTSAKFALANLDAFGNVEVLDLTATDSSLKGFLGGLSDGTYSYVVPYGKGARFGKVARFKSESSCRRPWRATRPAGGECTHGPRDAEGPQRVASGMAGCWRPRPDGEVQGTIKYLQIGEGAVCGR